MKSLARVVALLLALVVAGCQFLPWVGDVTGIDIPWRSVLSPGEVGATGWLASMGLPLTIAAGVALLGALTNLRALVVIGALLAVAVPSAWILVNALDSTGGVPLSAIRIGAYGAAITGFLLLLVAAVAADVRRQTVR
ncbi:hypothetical protein [Longivirga aurantiaca]|uniref:Lipoprotein n=1 Tax=Longivirga aurantiaca TaxID=1837743 RepID=A0ABW1T0J8_9ACTN